MWSQFKKQRNYDNIGNRKYAGHKYNIMQEP